MRDIETQFKFANLLKLLAVLCFASVALSGCKFEKVSENLYRGSIPGEKRMRELKAMGIKSIINLRTNPMEGTEKTARRLGLNYYHIKTGVFIVPKEKEIKQFIDIAGRPENQPVYVCCTLGTDRTAYYVACYRLAFEGWNCQKAVETMKAEGLKQWWPTFREYELELDNHCKMMKELAATYPESELVSTSPGLPPALAPEK